MTTLVHPGVQEEEEEGSSPDIKIEVEQLDSDDEEDGGPCLICSEECEDTLPIGAFIGGSFCLNRHLWSVFLLRQVLRFPKEECEKLLVSTNGKNPGDWCRVCGCCSEYVSGAMRLHCEILRLKSEMADVRAKIEEKLKLSLCTEWEEGERAGFQERKAIREYYKDQLFALEPDLCKEVPKASSKETGSHAQPPQVAALVPEQIEKEQYAAAVPELIDISSELETVEIPQSVLDISAEAEVIDVPRETVAVTNPPAVPQPPPPTELLSLLQKGRNPIHNSPPANRKSSPRKELKVKKKEANRQAARKYRETKRTEKVSSVVQEKQLQKQYSELMKEKEKIWGDILTIRGLLRNMIEARRNRISIPTTTYPHPPPPPPVLIPAYHGGYLFSGAAYGQPLEFEEVVDLKPEPVHW